jgi:hypothetical protein
MVLTLIKEQLPGKNVEGSSMASPFKGSMRFAVQRFNALCAFKSSMASPFKGSMRFACLPD